MMVRTKEGEPCCICPCPCEGIIEIIGKKWALCVLALLGNDGTLRFNKIAEKLPGISAKTLTEVLKDLQRTGLVKRQAFAEIPPRVEYHLTREGNELTRGGISAKAWRLTSPVRWRSFRTSVSVFALIPGSFSASLLKRRVPSFPSSASTQRAHFLPMISIIPSHGHGQVQHGSPSFVLTIM